MARSQDLLPARWQNREQGLSPYSGGLLGPSSSFFSGSPWQLARRMQDDFDRLFNLAFEGAALPGQGTAGQQMWSPTVDVSQDDKEWHIEADLPGVKQDDIDIQVRNDALVIRAEMKQQDEPQAKSDQGGNGHQNQQGQQQAQRRQYHQRERRYGFFERVLSLPPDVDEEQIRAEFSNGVLTVHIPKTEQQTSQGRRIPVQQSSSQAAVGSGGQEQTGQTSSGQSTNGSSQQNAAAKQEAGAR